MLIIGAKGFAKEVLEVFHQRKNLKDIAFYDDISTDIAELLFDKFPVLKNTDQVKVFFKENGNEFTIGIGNPFLRYRMYDKFIALGGVFSNCISPNAEIGSYDVEIGFGTNILSRAIISNSVKIGKGCLVYYNGIIAHDCDIGDFVELSPSVVLLGNVRIGSFTQIGANSTVLPNVKIGINVIIGAGSVVTKDIPDNCMALGIPAKVIKKLKPCSIFTSS